MVLHHIKNAAITVFSSKKYVAISVTSFIVFLTLYLFTLPATYTGGRIGLVSIQFLNAKLALFSFIMALLVSLIIPFTIYSFKQGKKTMKATSTSGFIGSILPPLLCCSPIIPSIAATLGAVSPAIFGLSGALQGFIATNETYILSGSTLLLSYSLIQTAKSTSQCIC